MLNLDPNTVIVFTPEEQQHIKSINNRWDSQANATKDIKRRINEHTLDIQDCRCAYCERVLGRGDVDIEHIADKGTHTYFTYEPCNLVSSCKLCNSPSNKGTKETILTLSQRNYHACDFIIVHPYLDNPDEHIFYRDDNRIIFDMDRCTPKAKATISLFNWHQYWAKGHRLQLAYVRNNPLPVEKEIFIQEISTYKR